MYRNLCCCIFTYDDKYEIYGRNNQNPNEIQGANGSYYDQFVLNGIGDLPNEIIVEFLFPYLGIYDIRNLGDVGDNRLKYLAEDYLSGSKYQIYVTNYTNVLCLWSENIVKLSIIYRHSNTFLA